LRVDIRSSWNFNVWFVCVNMRWHMRRQRTMSTF